VDDVNAFHLRCITDTRTDGRVFNLGSGVSYSVREIYDHVSAILQTDIPPLYKPDLPGEAQETLADISAAKALGWQPRVNLDQGLRSFVEYCRTLGIPCQT
jgi:nucleoside-diphosphate-sugar epimerase